MGFAFCARTKGSRGKIQLRCRQGQIASLLSQRQMVAPLFSVGSEEARLPPSAAQTAQIRVSPYAAFTKTVLKIEVKPFESTRAPLRTIPHFHPQVVRQRRMRSPAETRAKGDKRVDPFARVTVHSSDAPFPRTL
jgi:hypothetical protein